LTAAFPFPFKVAISHFKEQTCKKTDHFHTAQQKVENCKRDCVCEGWTVLRRQRKKRNSV